MRSLCAALSFFILSPSYSAQSAPAPISTPITQLRYIIYIDVFEKDNTTHIYNRASPLAQGLTSPSFPDVGATTVLNLEGRDYLVTIVDKKTDYSIANDAMTVSVAIRANMR